MPVLKRKRKEMNVENRKSGAVNFETFPYPRVFDLCYAVIRAHNHAAKYQQVLYHEKSVDRPLCILIVIGRWIMQKPGLASWGSMAGVRPTIAEQQGQ